VSFIKRTLAFLESIKDLGVENLDPLSSDEMGIGAQVQKRSLHLAEILRDSLVRLPNSEVSLSLLLLCVEVSSSYGEFLKKRNGYSFL
jgi:hypothetical protein